MQHSLVHTVVRICAYKLVLTQVSCFSFENKTIKYEIKRSLPKEREREKWRKVLTKPRK